MNNRVKHNPIVGCMRWGSWGANFSKEQYLTIINQCVDIKLNEFDHADIYGDYTTEAAFGEALKDNSSLRTKIKLITKCGIKMMSPNRPAHFIKSYDASAAHIKASVENSLKNFHTDYIDTLLIHRPDVIMDVQEIAEVISALKQEGKVKCFGVSNFTKEQVELLNQYIKVEQHQVEISPTNLDAYHNGILEQAQLNNIAIQSWSPLGNGLINGQIDRHNHIMSVVEKLSQKHSVSITSILLAFLYAHPANIIPVMGTTKFERLVEAKDSMQVELNRAEFYEIWTAAIGKEVA
jgi:predicted oxidoreductase